MFMENSKFVRIFSVRVDQIHQRNAVQIAVDEAVQLFPHGQRLAFSGPWAAAFVSVQTGHRGQRPLGQPQDLAHGVVLQLPAQAVSTALAPESFHQSRLGQNGNDALQIFFGNLLIFRNKRQGDIAASVIFRQFHHDSQGGDAGTISCIGREAGSGTRDGFESITDTKDACKLDQELTSTGGVIEAVAGNPNAIGYASLSAVEGKDTIKAVTVGGVACTEATVLDGSYAIQRPFVLVTKTDATLSPAAQAFFDYATSTAANDLIKAAGAVPVAK